jgi:hypothetical protein
MAAWLGNLAIERACLAIFQDSTCGSSRVEAQFPYRMAEEPFLEGLFWKVL